MREKTRRALGRWNCVLPRVRQGLHFALRVGGRRRVLVIVSAPTMISHVEKWLEVCHDIPGAAFFVRFVGPWDEETRRLTLARWETGYGVRAVWGPNALHGWDLIVSADLTIPEFYPPEIAPSLYLNHGSHMISADGGETTYAYGPRAVNPFTGGLKATVFLESNRRIAEMMNARAPFCGRVEFVGAKDADALRLAETRRDVFRAELGVGPAETLVVAFGSWRAGSLFHQLGEGFLADMRALMGEGYRFALSIHPNEYLPEALYRKKAHSAGQTAPTRPLGSAIDAQAENGFLVRSPSEDYVPWLIAADVVVSDFSSMAELAVIAGRRLILSDFDRARVWKHALIRRLLDVVPVLAPGGDLAGMLAELRAAPVLPAQEALRAELCAGEGAYARRVRGITLSLLRGRPKALLKERSQCRPSYSPPDGASGSNR